VWGTDIFTLCSSTVKLILTQKIKVRGEMRNCFFYGFIFNFDFYVDFSLQGCLDCSLFLVGFLDFFWQYFCISFLFVAQY
jgi:hypothetical protein